MSRKREYAKDSTRGKAPRIDPINYKPDVNVQVWVEARVLLMLHNWLSKYNRTPKYMSDIVRFVIEEVVDQLLEAGEVEKIEFSSTARDALKSIFDRDTLNSGGRGKRNVIHNMHLDEKRRGMLGSSDVMSVPGISRPSQTKSSISDDEWERTQVQIKEANEKDRQDMLKSLNTDENGIVIQPDMKGTYTKEQRELDINKAKESLGIDPNRDKPEVKELPTDTMSEIKDIFNSIKARTQPKPASPITSESTASSIPVKVTPEQTKLHIEKVKDKDRKEQDSWNSVEVGDLKPIK